MPFFKGFDRTTLHYKDVGRGKPIVFIHGNNVDSDSWEEHLTELAERGYRCLAYDKRGFGRSDLAGHGFDLDTFADDLDCFLQHLDLCEVTLVGHSIGTLEIVRYIARHGQRRLARIVLAGTMTPFILQTPDNPDGIPASALQEAIDATKADRPGYYVSLAEDFFQPGVSSEYAAHLLESVYRTPLWTVVSCAKIALTRACDVRADLASIEIPTLVAHGACDTFAPPALTAEKTAKAIPHATLSLYERSSHGFIFSQKRRFINEVATFIENAAALATPA